MIALCKLCFAFKFNLAKYDLANSYYYITAHTMLLYTYTLDTTAHTTPGLADACMTLCLVFLYPLMVSTIKCYRGLRKCYRGLRKLDQVVLKLKL